MENLCEKAPFGFIPSDRAWTFGCIGSNGRSVAAGISSIHRRVHVLFFNPNVVSVDATLGSDVVSLGNDPTGGFVYRHTSWAPVKVCTTSASCFNTPYTANGYENASLRFDFSPSDTDLRAAPPPSSPPSKSPEIRNTANNIANILGTPDGVLGPPTSLGPLLIDAPPPLQPACVFYTGLSCTALGLGIVVVGGVAQAIANDPIDFNYTMISTPTDGTLGGPGTSTSPVWEDFVSALNDIYGLPGVIQDSFNRAEGAFAAGAPQYWIDLQVYAGEQYALLAEADLTRIEADATALGFSVTPASVPEPGTLMLLGGAFLLWMGWYGVGTSRRCPAI